MSMDMWHLINLVRNVPVMEGRGVSHAGGLLASVLARVDRDWAQLVPNGKTTITFMTKNGQKAKIDLRFGSGFRDHVSRIDTKLTAIPLFRIEINTAGRDTREIRQVVAHEVTNVAQHFNGFANYSWRKFRNFARAMSRKTGFHNKYDAAKAFHSHDPAEYEARLVEILHRLSEGDVKEAAEELWWEAHYLRFSRRDWLRKAVGYGIDRTTIAACERQYRDVVLPHHQHLLKTHPELAEKVKTRAVEQAPVMAMLGLDFTEWRAAFDV